MKRVKFTFSHSLAGLLALLLSEILCVSFLPVFSIAAIVVAAVVGGVGIIVIATDVIEEVRNSTKMLTFLSVTVVEFLVFFAFQYHFLLHIEPFSFQGL